MARIYTEDLDLPDGLVGALEASGLEVVRGRAPRVPEGDAFAVVSTDPGITSSLRHEVNNPLTAVLGFTQLLLRYEEVSDSVREKLEKIHDHAGRVRDLISKPEDRLSESGLTETLDAGEGE
jgi:signal transduction histidine kinase